MKEDYNVHLNRKKIYRALKRVKEMVEGNERDQYGKLWDYLTKILRSNTRSTGRLDFEPILESPHYLIEFTFHLMHAREVLKLVVGQ